jgi:O-antigen ligase
VASQATSTASSGDAATTRAERVLVTVVISVAALGLTALSTLGGVATIGAIVVATYLLVLAVAGRERTAVLTMMLAFASAPAAKGLAPSADSRITPTDLLVALAVILLVPTLLARTIRLPSTYVGGVAIIVVMGTLATSLSSAPFASGFQFIQWLAVMVGLLVVMALWQPRWQVVRLLLWSYVAGQLVSLAFAVVEGKLEGSDRYVGLTHHPNAFAEGGLMAFAALMYLIHARKDLWYRILVLGCAALCVQSVLMSGSRAAAVVVTGLILLVPIIERSAVGGFLLAVTGALFVLALPYVLGAGPEGSALSRLRGTADAQGADRARSDAQEFGIELFLDRPLVGNGFAEVYQAHNVLLAVAAATGVLGLVGFLMVLFALARPMFGSHPQRRLVYLVWAYIGLMPTVPFLDNRTLWVPLSVAFLVAVRAESREPSEAARKPQATASTSAAAL